MSKNTTDKQIPNPENPEEMIDNPDYVEPNNEGDDDDDDDDDLSALENDPKVKKIKEKLLKDMKEKLDKAYSKVEEEKAAREALEKAERERQASKLREEGKLEEAHALEKAELQAQLKALEERLTKTTRDAEVRDSLTGLDFKTDKAYRNALRDITDELIKNDKGEWVHKSGVSIATYAKTYVEDPDNQYLFKPKQSSGGGTTTPKGAPKTGEKSIWDLPQAEVIARKAKQLGQG